MGRCGGLSFLQRLRSIRLDTSLVETRSRRNYYDRESLDGMFGMDEQERREQYMDETEGRGAVRSVAQTSTDTLDWYQGADREEEGDAPYS